MGSAAALNTPRNKFEADMYSVGVGPSTLPTPVTSNPRASFASALFTASRETRVLGFDFEAGFFLTVGAS
jgi:hypothetical protein